MTTDEVHSSFTLIKTHLMSLCSQREPGSLLPSVRQLVRDFEVSPVTVSKVIAELSLEGFVDARPGHGTFIRQRRTDWRDMNFDWQSLVLGSPPASSMNNLVMEAPPGCLNFANGYMDDSLLPERELARASARVLRRSTAWQRAPLGGLFELQKWFADRAFAGFPAGDVLIVQGGQAALGIAIRAIVPAGGTLLVESPTYLGPLVIARSAGIKLAPVPVDAEGMRADHLKAALERGPVQAIYLQPNFSNPSGVSLSDQRRLDIVELAREHNTFIIEDDYARDLSFTGQVPAPLFGQDEGHVVYVRSLTKSVAPSLRVAALCAQGPVLSRLRSALLVNDFFVPRPLQEIAVEFLASSSYKKHLTKLQTTFQARMSLACSLVDRRLSGCRVHPPEGGYSLWVSLPDEMDEDALCRVAEERGVIVNPGHWWFAAEPVGKHLRLSIAGLTEGDLPTAVTRLAAAMKDVRGAQRDGAC
jgi:DNA-binding transcriptional MocR family regulator